MSKAGARGAKTLATRVGVISDTHDVLDPRVAGAFAGVDRILHAGDIGRPEVLWELEAIAPVTAVLGNMDGAIPGFALERTARLDIAGVGALVVHMLGATDVHEQLPGGGVIVSGHTHVPSVDRHGEWLYLNPGSASQPRQTDGRRTVALLDIAGGRASARVVPL